MVYKVIGLMSGSSLDGLDIVYTHLDETRGQWSYEIKHAACIIYPEEWQSELRHAAQQPVSHFLRLHTRYGRFIGEQVNQFIKSNDIEHQVHFVASHGHTVFHEPHNQTTYQIGDGATIAAITGLPVITDLRALDVALGGQGAPIVPIGDQLLFGSYDYLLNIGGIANMTVLTKDNILAYDVCPANQILNGLAKREGKEMDTDGTMARQGSMLLDVLAELNDAPYYRKTAPKSLSNEEAINLVFPPLLESSHETDSLLHTAVQHIAEQVANAVKAYPTDKEQPTMLVTGGGALNTYLMQVLRKTLEQLHIQVVVPEEDVVKFKEALVMALIGTLRWREEHNVLNSVTGASRDSIGGALWMGQL